MTLPPKPVTLEYVVKQFESLQNTVRGLERAFPHLAADVARNAMETRVAIEILRAQTDAGFREVLEILRTINDEIQKGKTP